MPIEKLRPTFTLTDDRLAQLRQAVPEAFADGLINWEALRDVLGAHLEDEEEGAERFGLFWPGKRQARRAAATPSQGTLVPAPGEGVNEETTRNLFIEGENLEVLKLLLKSYAGKVKMIYIDPPYNTGNDFVYSDNYTEPVEAYLRRTGQAGDEGEPLTTNPKTSGRFHSNWLNMIYPRLILARQMLREDGAIFVSIDDNEMHNLREVMSEVFGEENFVATFVWQKRYSRDNRPAVGAVHDYILLYARDAAIFAEARNLLPPDEESQAVYRNPNNDPKGRWRPIPMSAQGFRPNQMYKITTPAGVEHEPPKGRCWSMIEPEYKKLLAQGRIWFGADGRGQPNIIRYLSEVEGFVPWTWWPHTEVGHTDEAKKEIHGFFGKEEAFDTPKPVRLITRMLQIATDCSPDDIVLDFFAGSCTTAQAMLEANRKDNGNRHFIVVQLPDLTGYTEYPTIAEIGKERIRRVIAKMHDQSAGKLDLSTHEAPEDLGFRVYKLARSHFRAWQPYQGENTAEVQDLFSRAESPLVEGWRAEDLRVEIMLQEGFPLDSAVARQGEFARNAVDCVSSEFCEHRLFVCLDKAVAKETVDALPAALREQDILVCLDQALSDESKMRLADRCNVHVI